jgi:predicted acetyltransferase
VRAILGQHPGEWEIFHYTANRPAGVFWPRAIAAAATEGLRIEDTIIDEAAIRLYKFRAVADASGTAAD